MDLSGTITVDQIAATVANLNVADERPGLRVLRKGRLGFHKKPH
jgi:hypothetical protein